MKQGDPGEDFFIIIEGNVVCTQYAKQGRQKGFDDAPVAVLDIIGGVVVALMVHCLFVGLSVLKKVFLTTGYTLVEFILIIYLLFITFIDLLRQGIWKYIPGKF